MNISNNYNGFKLISLELNNHKILGTISYDFLDPKDIQENIYTTVIIGPNGTGKSNLFRVVIELFRELSILRTGKERTKFVDGLFNLRFSVMGSIYEYRNFEINNDFNKLEVMPSKPFVYLYRWDEVDKLMKPFNFQDIDFPLSIVANSQLLTDKYPVLKSQNEEDEFPEYKYLGVRNRPQTASTRSYVRKTVEFIVNQVSSDAFKEGLTKITKFLELSPTINVEYRTRNTKLFFNGRLNLEKFSAYFDGIEHKYLQIEKAPPFKLNHFIMLKRENPILINEICDFCNKLYSEREIRFIKINRSSAKIIKYNITNDKDHQLLKDEYIYLEHMRLLGLVTYPDISFSEDEDYYLKDSSSGEYHFFSSMVGLMATIKTNSLLFIDEPEVSLHPNWQMKYISFMRELFSHKDYASCHILIATHSHFLISDLDGNDSNIIGLNKNDGQIEIVDLGDSLNTFGWSAEEVLYKVFSVRTTRNYYIEMNLRELLHLISIKSNDKQRLNKLLSPLENIQLAKEDPLRKIISSSKNYLEKL